MPDRETGRPDPDALLQQVRHEEAQARRGRLRIYFGASAGVGKTWAMLAAARSAQAQGIPLVIGLVETHGRADTEAMSKDLRRLPLKAVAYRDRVLQEFDLDAALGFGADHVRGLVLLDELAHSNAPGSRHPKRWQDVEELLAAGIDVVSTVNIQHLESLGDVVESITGVRQRETVPDEVVRRADQIELVDMSPEALRRRMAHGNITAAGVTYGSPPPNGICWRCWSATPGSSSARNSCCARSGGRRTGRRPTICGSTWPSCAESSRRTPRTPSTSSPSRGWAIGSRSEARYASRHDCCSSFGKGGGPVPAHARPALLVAGGPGVRGAA